MYFLDVLKKYIKSNNTLNVLNHNISSIESDNLSVFEKQTIEQNIKNKKSLETIESTILDCLDVDTALSDITKQTINNLRSKLTKADSQKLIIHVYKRLVQNTILIKPITSVIIDYFKALQLFFNIDKALTDESVMLLNYEHTLYNIQNGQVEYLNRPELERINGDLILFSTETSLIMACSTTSDSLGMYSDITNTKDNIYEVSGEVKNLPDNLKLIKGTFALTTNGILFKIYNKHVYLLYEHIQSVKLNNIRLKIRTKNDVGYLFLFDGTVDVRLLNTLLNYGTNIK